MNAATHWYFENVLLRPVTVEGRSQRDPGHSAIRKVVGWSMREALHASIALEALDMAIKRQRPAPGLIQHSDRGIQYAADEYRQAPPPRK